MKNYLIVGSRDLTEYANGTFPLLVLEELRKKGHSVTLFLIENGVIAGREGSNAGRALLALSGTGIRILAEDISCRARGLEHLESGITLSSLDFLADCISEGFDNIVWY